MDVSSTELTGHRLKKRLDSHTHTYVKGSPGCLPAACQHLLACRQASLRLYGTGQVLGASSRSS